MISMRRVVIGDIHGCFDELRELLDLVGLAEDDEVNPIGDIVDRGPKSPQVVEFFMRRKKSLVVKGNHERKHEGFSTGLIRPVHFGPNQRGTVRQFAIQYPRQVSVSYAEAIEYFKTLPLYIDLPEALLVHAGVMYGTPLAEQNWRILGGVGFRTENKLNKSTGLFNWCDSYPRDAKPVIFGHLGIGKAPWSLPRRDNIWPIDTGCASGGFLTAVTLPDFKVYAVRSRQKLWNEV
jgi:serine/threonine protein phosphatase 1